MPTIPTTIDDVNADWVAEATGLAISAMARGCARAIDALDLRDLL